MKLTRKFLAILMVFAMIMSMGMIGAFAAETTGSITIEGSNKGQVYTFYRLFEAIAGTGTNVSYKPLENKTIPTNAFFVVENGYITVEDTAKTENGELSTSAIEWLKSNVNTIGEKIKSVTSEAGGNLVVSELPFGYYYITTTTGTIATVDTTTSSTIVKDKNPGTDIAKTITSVEDGSVDAAGKNALAQIGTVVAYESRIPIANGAVNYKFTDTMTAGLTLDADSVKVYLVDKDEAVADTDTAIEAPTYGTLTAANQTAETVADIAIAFDNNWLANNAGKDIVIKYSATVNKDAVVSGEGNPNTAKIEWGNEQNPLTDTDEAKVYTAKITVNKVDGNNQALAGAKFMLMNSDGYYYKWDDTNGAVTWVEGSANASEVEAVAVCGDAADSTKVTAYQAEFKGLANGTYTLTESTVPAGYNKAADQTIVIKDKDVSAENISLGATVINNSGTELPSTGAAGTVIFVAVGSLIAVAAVCFLVTKKRMKNLGMN